MSSPGFIGKPKIIPVLDSKFRPAILEDRAYLDAVAKSGQGVPLTIALERGDGLISNFQTIVFNDNSELAATNFQYVERLTKTLLWARGGWKLTIGGSERLGEYIKKVYAPGGLREFDAKFMSTVYERPFTVLMTTAEQVPEAKEVSHPIGRHLKGCRIGFDAGGSDRKVSAVIDGETVYSEEVIWHPKDHNDPEYHYNEILTAMRTAASYLPRVDAIGVSAAGIYINNRVMVASLFNKVPDDLFAAEIKNIFLTIQKEMSGVPLVVANDGDVTALAGAMELNDTNVLGLAMGTSEAGGYVDQLGNITGWLNELAFIPVDFNPFASSQDQEGISSIESGGNYRSIGPMILHGSMSGQRALGKYQVMESNVGPWF